MAKRFIDTEILLNPNVRVIPTLYKLFWIGLITRTDHAGIWVKDFEMMSLLCGEKIEEKKALEFLSDNIVEIDGGKRWFIPKFLEFQYPNGLNEKVKAHNSAIKILKKFGLFSNGKVTLKVTLKEGFQDMDKDKDMVKDKDMDMDMDMDKEKVKTKKSKKTDFDEIINLFNKTCKGLPEVRAMTPKRKSSIKARIKEYKPDYPDVFFESVFEEVMKSKFLTGKNDRGWCADFDWIMNPNNFIKILEGKYNEKPKQQTGKSEGISDEYRAQLAKRLGVVQS